ncbi:uncharacterized protein LOC132243412 [Alligator mississippiensis]|uniref:uncharacterized protein LOC132243412 n=1 Tax=Alligator mississippiensis TaxID=8496 RepID=UPI0028774780|nr:uncharacterized protein LOC132243412 [Alligator mississippiensis]
MSALARPPENQEVRPSITGRSPALPFAPAAPGPWQPGQGVPGCWAAARGHWAAAQPGASSGDSRSPPLRQRCPALTASLQLHHVPIWPDLAPAPGLAADLAWLRLPAMAPLPPSPSDAPLRPQPGLLLMCPLHLPSGAFAALGAWQWLRCGVPAPPAQPQPHHRSPPGEIPSLPLFSHIRGSLRGHSWQLTAMACPPRPRFFLGPWHLQQGPVSARGWLSPCPDELRDPALCLPALQPESCSWQGSSYVTALQPEFNSSKKTINSGVEITFSEATDAVSTRRRRLDTV